MKTVARNLLMVLLALILAPVAFVGAGLLGFAGAMSLLEKHGPTQAPPEDGPARPEPFRITREQLDAMLEAPPVTDAATGQPPSAEAPPEEAEPPEITVEGAPPSDPTVQALPPPEPAPPPPRPPPAAPAAAEPKPPEPFASTVSHVRRHQRVVAAEVAQLDCAELAWARDWLWAARGLPFQSAEARAWFSDQAGYRPDASHTEEVIEASFNAEDLANRDQLNGALRQNDCPCPGGHPRKPCPD